MDRAGATAQRVRARSEAIFEKGWCRRFLGIHFWNIPKELEDRVQFQKQCTTNTRPSLKLLILLKKEHLARTRETLPNGRLMLKSL
jgi:hypothetical protein